MAEIESHTVENVTELMERLGVASKDDIMTELLSPVVQMAQTFELETEIIDECVYIIGYMVGLMSAGIDDQEVVDSGINTICNRVKTTIEEFRELHQQDEPTSMEIH